MILSKVASIIEKEMDNAIPGFVIAAGLPEPTMTLL